MDNVVQLLPQTDPFEELWKLYPNPRGKAPARRRYELIVGNGLRYRGDWVRANHDEIMNGVRREIEYRDRQEVLGNWQPSWRHLSTWLAQSGFDDDFEEPDPTDIQEAIHDRERASILSQIAWFERKMDPDKNATVLDFTAEIRELRTRLDKL